MEPDNEDVMENHEDEESSQRKRITEASGMKNMTKAFSTLGRRKKKSILKDQSRKADSCLDLTNFDRDFEQKASPRPDSGYDDSYIGLVLNDEEPTKEDLERKESNLSCKSNKSLDEEEKAAKYREEGMNKIHELIKTEKNYIENLKEITMYYDFLQKGKEYPPPHGVPPMPADMREGKDRIAFGNSRDLYDFHVRYFVFVF